MGQKVSKSFIEAYKDSVSGKKKEVEEDKVDLSEETELEDLTEEQLLEVMEEELTPYIAYLLDEGFNDEEIENVIVEMLLDEETN